jgi:hypothetical protein
MLYHFAVWQRQMHLAVLQGIKKSRMRIPSTTVLFPHPFAISYHGKKYSRILFGQTMYLIQNSQYSNQDSN